MVLTREQAKQALAVAKNKRERYWQRIQVRHDLIPQLADPTILNQFKVRLAALDQTFLEFEAAQNKIVELNALVEEVDQIKDVLSVGKSFEDMFYNIKSAESTYAPPVVPEPNPVVPPPSRPKLPQINIPVFDGTHESFSSFKSLFDALVHSQVGLTPIEKYSYLKSLLSGPALACIQGFSFSENNYQIAYQTLVNQFSNKRVVANSICAKLFSIKPLTHEAQLRSFLETFNVSVEAFKAVGINNQGDFLLLFMALRILDPTTRQAFENMWVEKEVVPQYKDLLKFVQGRVSVSDLMSPVVAKPAPTRSTPQASGYKAPPPATVKRSFVANVVSPKPTSEAKPVRDCPCCNQAHKLIVCNQFQRLSIPERYNFLREKQLCFACFGPHSRNLCTTRFSCRRCKSKKHHTLLHSAQPTGPADASPAYSTYPVQPNTSNSLTNVNPGPSGVVNPSTTLSCNLVPDAHKPSYVKQVLLGTAVVSVPDAFGRRHDIRILIDPGSMINIVTQSLANRLCLPSQPSQVSISGIGSGTPQTVTGVLSCTLESKHCPFALNVEAAILPRISANIPALPVSPDIIRQFANVELADPSFFQPSSVHMLLGAQHYADIIRSHEPIIRGEPSLVPSNFGVLVMGCAPAEPVFPAVQQSFFITNMENDLSNQLKRFWEMEEICVKPATNPEDDECEQHFIKTHRREPSGTYVVRLPFRNNQPPDLGNNRSQALNRLLKLERQLDRNPTFRELYHENIKDYLDVGHMIPASKPSDYLLIHHGVLKESSSTTKCRVVFSPAEHASPSHPSLNEALLVGPKLQNDITDIMLTFRLHPIVLTADIKQMYRCIKLDPRDSPYQQILWRFSPSDPVQQFEIQRVCFGVACAPYQALRVIKQLIQDEGHRFPLAAQALDSDTYIDDICTGASSVEEAGRLRDELVSLLATAGFELRKWSCSDPTVLRDLPLNYLEKPHQLGDIETIRVLGLQWDPHQDAFIYRVDPIENCVTKRQVLSQIARIYDLSGFVSPITIWMKILLQQVWLQGLDWDDLLPSAMLDQWNKFVSDMPCLRKVQIPRYILDTYVSAPELIGFSDASSSAMAAVVYLRVVCSDGRVLVNLIRAKSKVAPVKTVTIPRLELTASYMLALLIESLQPLRDRLRIETIRLFTDSMVVLSWLRTPPHLLKVFVANRVVKILDITSPTQWLHISTKLNPADLASRGCFPNQLVQNDLWWSGPKFLKDPPSSWPKETPSVIPDLPDLKESVSSLLVHNPPEETGIQVVERFSSLTRAQRVTAWMLRFRHNAASPAALRRQGCLSVEELKQSMQCLIRITQTHHFRKEIEALKSDKPLSNFRHLTPFLENDLLRVGGRLARAPLPYDSRHPIILPAKSHLALLIVRHYHLNSLHGGPKMIQCLVQRKYFICGLRDLVRKVVFKCTSCFRFTAKPHEAIMADLPPSRFAQGRPFVHTGVDLAGPFSLKEGYRRNSPVIKGYFAIFVCFATKAVHLELLTSLSTDCFLAALDRFIARRGLPSCLFSDQGTNFKGAARVLDETYTFLKRNEPAIIDHLTGREIQWTFNAPSNPSSGGLWEAGVKSVKHHLKRILNDRPLHYEEFLTLLVRIEALLNSRPIGVPASCPVDDVQCLTPGHFLIGAPLVARPETNLTDVPSNRLTRWELISQVTQHLWKRWATEYLHTLIQRQKWCSPSDNLKVGDIVVLTIDNQPPMSWPLARVTRVMPAEDGVVRIVSVRTSSGELTRPVRKLLVLPVDA